MRFVVPGRPVPKARARMGWTRDRRRRVWYTPEATRAYARTVAIYALQARRQWENDHGRPWPRNGTRYGLAVEVRTRRRRADGDNYLKQVADALQGVLWDNDRSVTESRVLTVSVSDGSTEAMEVTVHAMD